MVIARLATRFVAPVVVLVALGPHGAWAARWSTLADAQPCPTAFGFTPIGHGVAVIGPQPPVGQATEEELQMRGDWARIGADGRYRLRGGIDFQPVALALYGRDGFAVAGYRGLGGRPRPPFGLHMAFGSATGRLGHARPLAGVRYRDIVVRLAGGASGQVAALYGGTRTGRRGTRSELRLAVRGPGGRLRTVALLAHGRAVNAAQLVTNVRGDALAAWQLDRTIYARLRTAGGRLGPTQLLGHSAGGAPISLALDDHRRALVGWLSYRVEHQVVFGPATVRVAFAAAGGRFDPPRAVETMREPYIHGPGVRLAFVEGRGLIVWTAGDDAASRAVRTERVDLSGMATDRRTITAPGSGSYLSDMAVAPGRGAVVAWVAGPNLRPYASVAPTVDAGFGSAEPIGDATTTDTPDVEIDPASRHVLAIGPRSPVGCWTSVRS